MGMIGLRAIHIAAGIVALAVFWIPLVTRKGGRIHRRFGMIYSWAMGMVVVFALFAVGFRLFVEGDPALKSRSIFLAFIAILTAASAWNDRRHPCLPAPASASPALRWNERRNGIRQSHRSALTDSTKDFPTRCGISGAQTNMANETPMPSTAVRLSSARAMGTVPAMPLAPSRKNRGNAAPAKDAIGMFPMLTVR